MFLFIFLFIAFPVFSQAEPTWFLSKEQSHHKWALVPSYSRSGTLGQVIGGRVFVYPTRKDGFYLSGGFDWKPQRGNFLAYRTHFYHWAKSGSELEINFEYDTYFDSFYTHPSLKIPQEENLDLHHRVEVPSRHILGLVQYMFPLKSQFSMGGFLDFYYRKELGSPCFLIQNNSRQAHENCLDFSTESMVSSLGIIARKDTRDKKFNPLTGYFLKATAKLSYDFKDQDSVFFQTEARSLFVYPFLEDNRWVLNLALGWSFHPEDTSLIPYSSQFKLGGIDYLRGYRHGRFFSGEYYLIQNEIKISLNRWFQSVFFIDIGEIELFAFPYITAGLGFHIGFPPHYDQRIRFEWGVGKDQNNFVVAFALPY